MRTWDIAKLLVENSSSPEDVEETVKALKDPTSMAQINSVLEAFSSFTLPSPATEVNSKGTQRASGRDTPKAAGKPSQSLVTQGTGNSMDNRSMTAVVQLEELFRSKGMTNSEVEHWVRDNFDITVVVGKESLRKYLLKVLNRTDLGLSNRILAAAQRLATKNSMENSDIRDYWDQLDKRQLASQ